MLLANGFEPDPRVHKEARSALAAGYAVTILCLDRQCDLPAEQELDGLHIVRVRVGVVRAGQVASLAVALPRFYAAALRLAVRLHRRGHFALVHSHDLDTLPLGAALKLALRVPLVYDMHDLYSSFFAQPTLVQAVNGADRALRALVDGQIVVNDRFISLLGLDPARTTVVMNVPTRAGSGLSGVTDTGLFYAGNLDANRDMRYALEVLTGCGLPVQFAGDGPLANTYRALDVTQHITLLGRIPAPEVYERTRRCRAVLALYDTRFQNNRLASPNKLFDAMKYGKPAIVSDGSVMADIVRQYDCGQPVPYGDAPALHAAIEVLKQPERYAELCRNALAAFESAYSWEVMSARLVQLYAKVLQP